MAACLCTAVVFAAPAFAVDHDVDLSFHDVDRPDTSSADDSRSVDLPTVDRDTSSQDKGFADRMADRFTYTFRDGTTLTPWAGRTEYGGWYYGLTYSNR
jgi:hypothetical protein